jgi:predicted nucleic acid-binding protein
MAASVADTSVLAALVFQEARSEEAGLLLADADLYEPPLLAYELASVCRKKVLRYPRIERQLLEALSLGLALNIHWVDIDQPRVVQLAVRHNLTTYDASFLWVSIALGLTLHTFDERLGSIIE